MSPVFRRGELRLYLLKLLDEAPRHGYDVIRLLQDRFLGTYTPSPGVIYPSLARFEEEGLLTHDEIDGKKVYRITDLGRSQLQARQADLAELEDELAACVHDLARRVSEDVRQTVRNLREELTSAAQDTQDKTRQRAGNRARKGRGVGTPQDRGEGQRGEELRLSRHGRERPARDLSDWTGWARGASWTDPAGTRASSRDNSQRIYADLEWLAMQFVWEVQIAGRHAETVNEDTLGDLRKILDEALERIKAEIFNSKTTRTHEGRTDRD